MKFSDYIFIMLKFTFSSSLAIGLVLGVLVLVIGGAEGTITFDIDLSSDDSIRFLLGVPLIVTTLFLLFAPISFIVHSLISYSRKRKTSHDS